MYKSTNLYTSLINGMLDTSAPGQFGTRTLRLLCETFRVLLPRVYVTLAGFSYPVDALGLIAPRTLNYLAFQSLDFERT
jgi:hypothetical protein